jgi:hypothetical protein
VPPIDPQSLTPIASLNRVQLVDLPGLTIDPAVRGKTGGQLVSAAVLARLIRQHANNLQLDPNLDDHALHLALDRCLASPDTTARTTAEVIGRRIGRNLGYILLTLNRGDAVNRAARDEWDDSYWDHWHGIRHVWLGGGLVSGRLSSHVSRHAESVLNEAGVGDYTVRVSPYAPVLPLVGAARCSPRACRTALVFDLGNTMIKCARVIYENDELSELHRLPSYPVGWTEIEQASDDPAQRTTRFLSHLITTISQTWHGAGMPSSSPILASMAVYVQDGHPMIARGAYGQFRRVTDNLQDELAQRLSVQLGTAIDVSLIHDGTAAATAYAGMENTAVIMMGTALGIGFPPLAGNLWVLSPNLTILGP